MSRYILYTYQFSPISEAQTDLFERNSVSIKETMAKKQDILQKFFDDECLFKTNRVEYSHLIIYNEDGFIAFKLANQKLQHVEENFLIKKQYNHPSCNVVIDNRTNVQHVAIEEDYSSFADTDVVAHILTSAFNNFLRKYRLQIEIKKEYQKTEFWKLIEDYPNGIHMVRFCFSYPNLPRVSEAIDDMIKNSSKETNSTETTFEFKARSNERLVLSHDNLQLNKLIQSSADSGNLITMKANGYRKYIKTGDSCKSIDIDDIEKVLHSNLYETVSEKLSNLFKQFK